MTSRKMPTRLPVRMPTIASGGPSAAIQGRVNDGKSGPDVP